MARARVTLNGFEPRVLALCVLIGGALLPFVPYFVFQTIPYEDDIPNYFWPVMHRVAESLRAGQLPLWTGDLYNGFPLFADSESGALFPLNWVMIGWNTPQGFVLVLALSTALSAVCMYALARHLQFNRAASVIAGWVFALGGFSSGHLVHVSIGNSAATMPLVLLALDRVFQSRGGHRAIWLVVAAAAHALQWLGGHAQVPIMTWMLAGAFLVFRVGGLTPGPSPRYGRGERREGRGERLVVMKVARLLIVPLLMGGLAFGMAAAQLIPTLELANASARGVGVDYGFATSYSFPPYNLVTLIWPYFFRDRSGAQWGLWANWETAVYVGILPLMLVVTGLVLRRNRQTVFWALVAVVSVWLAMAEYAPLNVHHWLYSLPVFNVLRAPARFLLVTDFALAVLAANGAHALLSGENASRRGRMSAVGLLLAAGALVIGAFSVAGLIGANREAATAWLDANYRALPNSGLLPAAKRLLDYAQWAVWLGNPRFAASVIALFAGALWLALAASRRLSYPLLRAITLLLVLGDLSYFASDFWQAVPVEAISQPEPVTQWLIAHTDGARVFSWPRSATQPDRLLRWGVPEAAGYSSLEIQRQSQILDAIQNSNNRLLDLSGAAWVVVPPRPTPEPSDAGATAPPRPYDPRAPLVNLVASSPSSQRTFVLSPPQTITSLHIVSALEHAPQVNQGDTVAQIIVTDTLGRAMRLPIRAGIESAEWALERPDIRGFARHRLAPVVFSFTANDDSSTPYTRHLYQADIPVGENTASIRAIELEVAARAGREVSWLVYALEAMTANGAPAWRAGRFDLLNFAPASESDRARIVRNQSALPRASLVYTGAVLADAPSLLARLTQPAFDPRAVLYLEEMPSGPALNLVGGQNRGPVPGGAERVSLVTLSDRHVQVQVDAPSDAFLLLTDTWYNGWAARDNGQPTKIYRADYLYRAVFVSAGPHQIDFTFEPESVRVGFMLTAATLVIAGMLVLAARQYDSSMAKRGRIRDREGK